MSYTKDNKLKKYFYGMSHPDMLHGPIGQSLFAFSIPVFFSMLFQSFYSMADTFIIGHVLGETAYAAVGAGAVVCDLLIVFATGVGLGMSMIIARRFGAKDYDGIKKAVFSCLIVGILLSFLLAVFGLFTLKPLLHLLNTPAEIFDGAFCYARIIIVSILACFLYNMFCGMLKALGNSFVPLLFLVFSSILNILLDYVFVALLQRGVAGAAEATALSQAFSAFLCGIYIVRKAKILLPEKRHFHLESGLYLDIFWSGFSMGMMNAIVTLGTLTLQYGINSLGTLTIAAHTAARKLFSFGTLPMSALASAISMFVSQNHGARQYTRIRKALKYSYIFDFFYAFVISIVFWIFAESAVHFITGSDSAVILDAGSGYLYFVGPFYFVLGVLINSRYALQGIGKKILPMFSSVTELIGKIIFTFLFVPKYAYSAVIVCEPIIWCVMTIQLLISLYTRDEMKRG